MKNQTESKSKTDNETTAKAHDSGPRFCGIIPHYHTGANSTWLLRELLESVKKWEPELPLLVIEDCGPGEDKDKLWSLLKEYQITTIQNAKNLSYAKTVNRGMKLAIDAGFDWAITINNDVQFIEPIVDHFKQVIELMEPLDRGVAVIGPTLLYPSGKVQSCGFNWDDRGEIWQDYVGQFITSVDQAMLPLRLTMGVTGAVQAIDLQAAADVGFYDPEFQLAFEDVEFCKRIWERGYSVVHSNLVKCIHAESQTRGRQLGPKEMNSVLRWQSIAMRDQTTRLIQTQIAELASQLSRRPQSCQTPF